MRTLYDSTTAADIPADAQMVAGYVDGRYAWSDSDWALFPNAIKVGISCLGTNAGLVLDIENGCATSGMAPDWIRARQAAGIARPVVYVNRGNWQAVANACAGLQYDVWLATLDCIESLAPGTVATQWSGQGCSPGHYDRSLVSDNWLPGGPMLLDQPQAGLLQEAADTGAASHNMLRDGVNPNEPSYLHDVLKPELDTILSGVQGLSSGNFTATDRALLNALVSSVSNLSGAVTRIENALKGA